MMTHDKMKVGNLYLYNMDPEIDKGGRYVDLPVIALSENSDVLNIIPLNASLYPTWLCLFPNLTTAGLYPSEMIDITLKK